MPYRFLPLLLCLAAMLPVRSLPAGADRARARTFVFNYEASIPRPAEGAKDVEVWIPWPETDANQTVHRVRVDAPSPVTLGREPREGNRTLYARLPADALPARIALEVVATRRESTPRAEPLSSEDRSRYLAAEPLVPLDGPVLEVAREAVRGRSGAAAKARGIYETVTGLLRYDKSGQGWGRGDAVFACSAKRGNCTDFHALVIGAARSQGIPARFAIGFTIPEERGAGEVPGYHCWAELYVDGRWVPIDSSEGAKALAKGDRRRKDYYYGRHDENRIEFSRGRHLVFSPRQKAGPVNFHVYPYAEADGRPLDSVARRFAYRDLPAPE